MNKAEQRQIAYLARNAQADKDAISVEICRRVVEQPWYQSARTVMWYLNCRSEVRTLSAVATELGCGKGIVVPYCTVDSEGQKQLGLWYLKSIEELQPGMWNILEPPRERWLEPAKQVSVDELDAIIVPGVAFDKQGGRLGNGAGYYDRLLQKVRPDAVLAAISYEAQLLPQVVMDEYDVFMDFVVTEQAIYSGKGRTCRRT
ncbi:5-formyltetrahydrofolate cyclo-ligase [Methylomonas methanica]|uniref:5-formyltetrahydrofolate cyclo-ligase n=1 Tax=Methylomonas methanica TaxID=421 RepID=A0A177LVY4_METMH|nr:5-formyltetrahydrofolate cyclo-ligase [Methylomonas methanica]OAH97647.1 5-formyltetrahydrofolate cyclo-ligase [Methylomonas methanica]